MLKIHVPKIEAWDEASEEFITINEFDLQLEHSLLSLSKWEALYCKPFLDRKQLSNKELKDYIKCMTITQNVDPRFYDVISADIYQKITDYIGAPMTATTFSNDKNGKGGKGGIVTSELIYFWMISFNIPFECEKWHLNRLMTLIRVCEAKNSPSKKMSKQDILNSNRSLNAARRARMKSRG